MRYLLKTTTIALMAFSAVLTPAHTDAQTLTPPPVIDVKSYNTHAPLAPSGTLVVIETDFTITFNGTLLSHQTYKVDTWAGFIASIQGYSTGVSRACIFAQASPTNPITIRKTIYDIKKPYAPDATLIVTSLCP